MKKLTFNFILLMLLLLTLISLASAQEVVKSNGPYRNSYWMGVGLGYSTRSRAAMLDVNAQVSKQVVVSLSLDLAHEPDNGLFFTSYSGYDMRSFSIKAGKIKKWKWGMVVYSMGISKTYAEGYTYKDTWVDYRYEGFYPVYDPHYEKQWVFDEVSTIGFCMDMKIIPARNAIGGVINPFININGKQVYGGLTLGLALGRVHYVVRK